VYALCGEKHVFAGDTADMPLIIHEVSRKKCAMMAVTNGSGRGPGLCEEQE
jgi:hypothetical protein